jgi:hypothetical protein
MIENIYMIFDCYIDLWSNKIIGDIQFYKYNHNAIINNININYINPIILLYNL